MVNQETVASISPSASPDTTTPQYNAAAYINRLHDDVARSLSKKHISQNCGEFNDLYLFALDNEANVTDTTFSDFAELFKDALMVTVVFDYGPDNRKKRPNLKLWEEHGGLRLRESLKILPPCNIKTSDNFGCLQFLQDAPQVKLIEVIPEGTIPLDSSAMPPWKRLSLRQLWPTSQTSSYNTQSGSSTKRPRLS